ncbi:MAG: hypothetical protein EHM28_05860 [Spirochaetaceae bacterium]|nr:MAG: hypothetical protein EHM28_05860 [Spirochaetaceae bacterium]
MSDSRKKTAEQIVIFSTHPALYYGLAAFLGLFFACILLSIFYLAGVPLVLETGGSVILVFLLFIISAVLVKTEFKLYVKSDFEGKPPLQFLLNFVIGCAILYYLLIVKHLFTTMSNDILPYLTAPVFSAVGAWLVTTFTYILFLSILRLFDRFRKHSILLFTDFIKEMDHRIHDFKRYKNYFSLIVVGIWVTEKYKERLPKMIEYPLVFEIVRRNIRRGDVLGISKHGDRVLVLSVHNAHENAGKHAQRIIHTLSQDPVLRRMIDMAAPEYMTVIKEGHDELGKAQDVITQANTELDALFVKHDKEKALKAT